MNNVDSFIYAPVMIPTLCRFEHFKACVDSLSECTDADKTELYIGLDYPKNESHYEGYNKICRYIERINGFKNVTVIRHSENVGVAQNNQSLRDVIFKKHDRYIYSEDDNVFSPNFLVYINQGLEKYKDNPKVAAITGFSLPQYYGDTLDDYPYNIYPYKRFYAWGFGTWVSQYKEVERLLSKKSVSEILHSFSTVRQVWNAGFQRTIHRLISRNEAGFGDLVWAIYCILNDKYSIVPVVPKVKNIGFDGSGENCLGISSVYVNQEIDGNAVFKMDSIEIKDYSQVKAMHQKGFGTGFWLQLYYMFEYFTFKVFGIKIVGLSKMLYKLKLSLTSNHVPKI